MSDYAQTLIAYRAAVDVQLRRIVAGHTGWSQVTLCLESNYHERTTARRFGSVDAGTLQSGDLRYQHQTFADSLEVSDSSNTSFLPNVTTLVVVVRAVLGDWDERLYTEEVMLNVMEELLNPATWRALSQFADFSEEPRIDLEPERDGDLLRFRTRMGVRLNAL